MDSNHRHSGPKKYLQSTQPEGVNKRLQYQIQTLYQTELFPHEQGVQTDTGWFQLDRSTRIVHSPDVLGRIRTAGLFVTSEVTIIYATPKGVQAKMEILPLYLTKLPVQYTTYTYMYKYLAVSSLFPGFVQYFGSLFNFNTLFLPSLIYEVQCMVHLFCVQFSQMSFKIRVTLKHRHRTVITPPYFCYC